MSQVDAERGADSATTPSDGDLVTRVRENGPAQYEALVRRHQDSLFRQAVAMGLDLDTAADLVQEALVRAYQGLDGCRNPERFRGWIGRILHNLCLDHRKSVAIRSRRPLSPTLPDPAAGPERVAARGALRDRLAMALARLPAEQREAFLLRHGDGMGYGEMAESVGVSVSALKMRVHRAREALRTELEERFMESDVTDGGAGSS